ncbi:MAG: carboxypeptidase-like regulatory domain-containing protein, partial [Gammaproteobacteria bacterium]
MFTDDEGQFILSSPLKATRFSKAGYADKVVGPAELTGAFYLVDLAPGGAIIGRVINSSGVAIPGVAIGVRRLLSKNAVAGARFVTDTDDRGEYRLGALAEGSYAIELVTVPGFRRVSSIGSLLNQIQDGRTPASARVVATVSLGVGEEIRAVDIVADDSLSEGGCTGSSASIQTSEPDDSARVKGRVITTAGNPVGCATVRLARTGTTARVVKTDTNGQFTFANVGAGVYAIDASRTGYVAVRYHQETATAPGEGVTVKKGQTVGPIVITLPKGGAIEGVV